VVRAEAVGSSGVLGKNYDDVAVGGEGVDVEEVEVGKRPGVAEELVQSVQSPVNEL
jgi:hypothetical protein